MIAKPRGLVRIWRKITKPFLRKIELANKMNALRAGKNEIITVFGASSEISNAVDTLLRFNRWKLILGRDVVRFLRIPEPRSCGCWLYAQHIGVDLEAEIQSTDEAWILDGIKLPHVASKERALWNDELSDIVFPSYLRRKSGDFDTYYDIVENCLEDFCEGPYEYGDVCLGEGDVVFDCGANLGVFSAVASRYGAEVFAFEAIPDIIDDYLSKTASLNDNIHIVNVAVWDEENTLSFSLVPDNIGASRADILLQDGIQTSKQFVVPAITLDAFVERNGIQRVDFIKADIEGAERCMLRGATRILREFAPKLSICTYHLPDDPKVLREIILAANPDYQIIEKFKKMYAHVPKRTFALQPKMPFLVQPFKKAS